MVWTDKIVSDSDEFEQGTEQELETEIERCSNAKDGDEHFSKDNWNLRAQFCRGELKGFQEGRKQALGDVNKLIDNFPFKDYTDFEIGEDIKLGLKERINKMENNKMTMTSEKELIDKSWYSSTIDLAPEVQEELQRKGIKLGGNSVVWLEDGLEAIKDERKQALSDVIKLIDEYKFPNNNIAYGYLIHVENLKQQLNKLEKTK